MYSSKKLKILLERAKGYLRRIYDHALNPKGIEELKRMAYGDLEKNSMNVGNILYV